MFVKVGQVMPLVVRFFGTSTFAEHSFVFAFPTLAQILEVYKVFNLYLQQLNMFRSFMLVLAGLVLGHAFILPALVPVHNSRVANSLMMMDRIARCEPRAVIRSGAPALDYLLREMTSSFEPSIMRPIMPCDVQETKDSLIIQADLPGVSKDSIEITLEKNVLTIQANKEMKRTNSSQLEAQSEEGVEASSDNDSVFRVRERSFGKVTRVFQLPPNVAAGENAQASSTFVNGVLTITLQKQPEAQPRRISIA